MADDRVEAIRARLRWATPGPWCYNSYSHISAGDYAVEDAAWQRAPKYCDFPRRHSCTACIDNMCQAPDDLYELDTTVCDVPAHHGDTAIGRHKADAELIASAPSDLTYLASALSAAEERVEDLEAALQRIADLPSGAIPGHAVAVGCRHNIVAWKALNAPGGTECEACDGKGWNMDYGPWRTEGVPNTPGYRVTTVHAEQGDFTVTMGRQIPCPAGCDHGWLAPTQAAEGER